MKSFQNIVFALATLAVADAVAVTSATGSTFVGISTTPADSGSTVTTSRAATVTSTLVGVSTTRAVTSFSTSIPVVSSSFSSSRPASSSSFSSSRPASATGGFIFAGVYTTCLEVTFGGPTATASTGFPVSSSSSVANAATSSSFPESSTVDANGSTSTVHVNGTVTSFPTSTVHVNGTVTSFPTSTVHVNGTATASIGFPSVISSEFPAHYAVFTTCLVFLPSSSATASSFPSSSVFVTEPAGPTTIAGSSFATVTSTIA
ncbi:hypothetical protein B0H17DRAFT_1224890 [Mycena rosella]|uniref:Uncharacterized protein n=1 Tax=Mycena rosella TaxID=1033263 RepID=A0AAD7D975_MYCRO|nr:hypothetical protein B0H17DRAFT_1224890 [Mycena rosella]